MSDPSAERLLRDIFEAPTEDMTGEHDETTGDVMITVWPADMLDGDPYPPDFYARLDAVLTAAGFLWDRC